VVRADDGAFAEGRGCYTSVRIRGGAPRFAERHARRLVRGAEALRLDALDPARVTRALDELAAAAFPRGEGIVRLQVSRDPSGALHLVGVPRGLGDEPASWRAIVAPIVHDGGLALPGGYKLSNRLALSLAADAADAAGAHEALLLDAAGHLVEGARSNLLVAIRDGSLLTPPLTRGAVDGIGRQLALARVGGIAERDVSEADLREAREIIAVNAVRGAVPIVSLDARPVGDGVPGPRARRLAAALDRD
jgi:branched-subunit amino acid aminotransferase/4-amino-4-deoxychorismate lyase